MKREWIIALAVMGVITFILLLSGALLILKGPLQTGLDKKPNIQVYVQAPPVAALGDDVQLTVMIENDGDNFASIDEFRLPASLTDAAVIKDVFPTLYPGRQQFYGSETGYKIGLVLEPGERREFVIQMMPWQIADVAADLQVLSGDETIPVGFRMLFNKPLAAAATPLPPPTLAPTWTPTWTAQPLPTQALTPTPLSVPYKSVVKIIAKVKYSSYLRALWGGSGTVIASDGLILTNAHLVLSAPGARPDVFVIAMTEDPAEPPVERYYAEPILTDEDLDLAIVQITTDLDGNPVDWEKNPLSPVVFGDSDAVQLGDPLTILGYPGIGGDTITLTSGAVGGFTAQRTYGDRAYIKTSATISGGTSGGLVLNSQGQMIAIPTQLGSGLEEDVVDCRVIADTNGDGRINQFDACVPVGGFINALRPVKLAEPLIATALQMAGSGP